MKIFITLLMLTSLVFANQYSHKKIIKLKNHQGFKITRLEAIDFNPKPQDMGFKIGYTPSFDYKIKGHFKSASSLAADVAKRLRNLLDKNEHFYLTTPAKGKLLGYKLVRPKSYLTSFKKINAKKQLIVKLKDLKVKTGYFFFQSYAKIKALVRYELKGFGKANFDELAINAELKVSKKDAYESTCQVIASELAKQILNKI